MKPIYHNTNSVYHSTIDDYNILQIDEVMLFKLYLYYNIILTSWPQAINRVQLYVTDYKHYVECDKRELVDQQMEEVLRFTAISVADKLMDLFSRVGVPNEILTDQGTNLLYQILGIKAITTSPYNPHTDGLVERLNQTLKLILKKTLRSNRRQWDKLLPYVLFAYREILRKPQDSVPSDSYIQKT